MELTNIFEGERLRLTEIDPKQDGEIESGWMLDLDYARQRTSNPVHLLNPTQLSKDLEEKLKESEESRSDFYYAIRTNQEEGELVGFMFLTNIEWNNGQSFLQLLLKDESSTAMYLKESLQLSLRYIFNELNLYHVCMYVTDFAETTIHIVEEAGFAIEARLRELIYREGSYHDCIIYGLLAEEWRKNRVEE
ncbi:MAG TPA: hypothetical protein DCK95_12145 [Anaerolineaceae bacterium]|nr:hypothetical protein [Anaerolineaceae bacterium]